VSREFNDKVRGLYVDMITDLLDLVWVQTGMISLISLSHLDFPVPFLYIISMSSRTVGKSSM
jgi:hypothetical protein